MKLSANPTGSHFWSISIEEQFYLLAPLVIIFAPLGRNPLLWATAAIALYAANREDLYFTDFSSITLGVLAATLKGRFGQWHLSWLGTALIAVVAIVSAFGLAIQYRLAAPFFALTVVLLCARPGVRSELGRLVGGISYPMYLNHWIGVFAAHAIAKFTGVADALTIGLIAYAGGVAAGLGA